MKYKFIILSFILILFTSCSDKSATSVFGKDKIYAQNLQYTKVEKLIIDNEVEVLINITYLNSANSLKWDNKTQNFLIGLYISNPSDDKYHITMNNQKFISKIKVNKNDIIYKNIAIKNNWADYYIISFENTKSKKLVINLSHKKNGIINIPFSKE